MAAASEGQWTVVGGSAGDLRVLSARLKAAGEVGLRRNMAAAVRRGTAPARAAAKAKVAEVMPHSGGLAALMARSSVTTQIRTGARSTGVTVRMRGPKDASGKTVDVVSLNRGRLRHPLFGNRDYWFDQQVPAYWWQNTLVRFHPLVSAELTRAMAETAKQAGF